MEQVKFKLSKTLTQADVLGEYEYLLTDHPEAEDLKVVHFKLKDNWSAVNYLTSEVEENFKNGTWIKLEG